MERRRAGADAALCECRGGRGGRWACAPRGGSPCRVSAALQASRVFSLVPKFWGWASGGGLDGPLRRQQLRVAGVLNEPRELGFRCRVETVPPVGISREACFKCTILGPGRRLQLPWVGPILCICNQHCCATSLALGNYAASPRATLAKTLL